MIFSRFSRRAKEERAAEEKAAQDTSAQDTAAPSSSDASAASPKLPNEGGQVDESKLPVEQTAAPAGESTADADAQPTTASNDDASATPADAGPAATTASDAPAVKDRSEHGPHDATEIDDRENYLDLGALLISPTPGLVLRLEVHQETNRVLAAILDLEHSSLQLQAFAAPRSGGLWDEVREQIVESVESQSGQAHEVQSHFGTEIVASVPAVSDNGDAGVRVARFVGVEGPRWFLRGVITGDAAMDPESSGAIEQLFRDVVVVRGDEAMAPRDLLTLKLPDQVAEAEAPQEPEPVDPTRRGPEITQIG